MNTTGESLTTQSTYTLTNTITNNTTSPQVESYTVTPTSSYTALDGGGYFYFDSIPAGCYDVMVDIPGLHRDSIWNICIDSFNTPNQSYQFLDYVADSFSVYILPQVVTGTSSNTNSNKFTVYPNPFIGNTTIEYDLQNDAEVRLEIFDVVGKKIESLIDLRQQLGNHKYTLNAPDKKLKVGVYFVTLMVNGNSQTKRVIIMD